MSERVSVQKSDHPENKWGVRETEEERVAQKNTEEGKEKLDGKN